MAEKYKEMSSTGAGDGMRTSGEALIEVIQAWAKFRSDECEENWMWCILDGSTYRVACSGSGGLAGMANAASANEDCIWFGGFRIEKPATKFFHVLYVPTKVSPLKRGKAQLQKSAIFNCWVGGSGEFSLTEVTELALKEGIAKALRCKIEDL
jgi:hypothetical protein